MERVGIRELRQNLSVYVRRVKDNAETLEVTEHGRPVAVLAPLPATSDRIETLFATNRLRRARSTRPLRVPPGRASRAGTEALEAEREERL